jgi:hypothetical protein
VRSLAGFARRVPATRWRLGSTWVAVVGVIGLAIGPLGFGGPAADAAPVPAHTPLRACTAKFGVLVVADFRYWGQPVERGCAPTPTTGYAALHAAGFTSAGDAHDGNAFVCRIDDEPPPNADGCQSTPLPPDSWSYWHALAGSTTWSYSQLGAMAYHPPPGSVDAWVFGTTAPPSFSPNQARSGTTTAPTTTTTTTSPSTTSTTAPPATTTTTAAVAATTSAPPATVTTTTEPARSKPVATTHRRAARPARRAAKGRALHRAAHSPDPTTTTTNPTGPRSSPPTTTLRIVNAAAGPAKAKPGGSSPLGVLVALAAVVVIAGAGAATAWRRRRVAG